MGEKIYKWQDVSVEKEQEVEQRVVRQDLSYECHQVNVKFIWSVREEEEMTKILTKEKSPL